MRGFVEEMLREGYDQEAIFLAMDQLNEEWLFQGDWSDNPITGSIATLASMPLTFGWLFETGIGNIAWATQETAKTDNLAEWMANAYARWTKGVLQTGMGTLGFATSTTPLGAGINTAFTTDTVARPIEKNIVKPIQEWTKWLQSILWFDPNSQASRDVQEIAGMTAPLAILWWAQYAGAKWAPYVKPLAKWAVEKVGKGVDVVKDTTTNITRAATTKLKQSLLWLDEAQVKWIQSNPYFKEYWQKTMNRADSEWGVIDTKWVVSDYVMELSNQVKSKIESRKAELSEDGKAYNMIRESGQTVEAQPLIENISKTLENNWLKWENGEVVKNPWIKGTEINQTDISKLSSLIKWIIEQSEMNGGKLTASELLDIRKITSNMAKYDANATSAGVDVIRWVRVNIDKVAKDNIKWLKEIDNQYRKELKDIAQLEEWLVYKQWGNKGEFKDNFENYIRLINNDAKSGLRKRLQDIFPELTTRIEAINQIPHVYKVYQKGSPLTGEGIKVTSAMVGLPWGVMWAALGYILGIGIGKGLTKAQKWAIDKVVDTISEKWIQNLNKINEKIQKNELISKNERAFIEELKQKIQAEIDSGNIANNENKSNILTPKK